MNHRINQGSNPPLNYRIIVKSFVTQLTVLGVLHNDIEDSNSSFPNYQIILKKKLSNY